MEKCDQSATETLTPREREIMQEMVSGHRRQDIAKNLDISPVTVDVHAAKIRKKLSAKTREESIAIWTTREIVASSKAADLSAKKRFLVEVESTIEDIENLEAAGKMSQRDADNLKHRLGTIKLLVEEDHLAHCDNTDH